MKELNWPKIKSHFLKKITDEMLWSILVTKPAEPRKPE